MQNGCKNICANILIEQVRFCLKTWQEKKSGEQYKIEKLKKRKMRHEVNAGVIELYSKSYLIFQLDFRRLDNHPASTVLFNISLVIGMIM